MSRGAFLDASKLLADHPEARVPEPDSPTMKSGQCVEVFFAYLGLRLGQRASGAEATEIVDRGDESYAGRAPQEASVCPGFDRRKVGVDLGRGLHICDLGPRRVGDRGPH